MSERILFVDDDPNLLASCERNFHRHYAVDTATGGEVALAKLAERGPYAVVVSDRQMPKMDGIQLLSEVRKRAPETVRIMLTGNADLEAAVRVVNEGNIFRFLVKPCPPDTLGVALDDACALYRLGVAEKELLNKTLSGSVKLLTDILSTLDARSFGRTERMRTLLADILQRMPQENAWEIHLAAMLAPIGYLTLPPDTALKARSGQALSKNEEKLVLGLPEVASRLLNNIPRLQGVARIVRFHEKHYDGAGFPAEDVQADAIPAGSRLLRIVFDLMQLQAEGMAPRQALNEMQQRRGWYDSKILGIVRSCYGAAPSEPDTARPNVSVTVADLRVGMVLYSNIVTKDGTLVLSSGHQISQMSLERIQNFEQLFGIKEPIFVEIAG